MNEQLTIIQTLIKKFKQARAIPEDKVMDKDDIELLLDSVRKAIKMAEGIWPN